MINLKPLFSTLAEITKPIAPVFSPFKVILKWYEDKLLKRPYLTSSITAGTLGGIGDIMS